MRLLASLSLGLAALPRAAQAQALPGADLRGIGLVATAVEFVP
jgi:hypothetical protein